MMVTIAMIAAIADALVRAQSADVQAMCAAQAQASFQQLGREYTNVLESLTIPFRIVSTDYRAHYSGKVDRCLFLLHKTVVVMHELSDISYLIDADNRQMYALYVDRDGKMESCQLIPSIAETTDCKDRGEFDAFVALYMER